MQCTSHCAQFHLPLYPLIPKEKVNKLVFACLLCVPLLKSWQKRVKSDVQVIHEQSLIQDMYFVQKKKGFLQSSQKFYHLLISPSILKDTAV